MDMWNDSWKKIAVAGTAVAALVGGTVAVSSAEANAASSAPAVGGSTASPSAGTSGTATPKSPKSPKSPKKAGARLGRGVVYGSWVTKDKKTGALVTHDEIRGKVSAVSPTSITVVARNQVKQTYTVNSATTVRMRATKSDANVGSVRVGASVVVIGTGTTSYTATRIAVAK